MQKYPHSFIVVLLFVTLASCDSATDSNPSACGNVNERLKRVSFELDGVLWDYANLSGGFGSILFYTTFDTSSITFTQESDSVNIALTIRWPGYGSSGYSTWTHSSRYYDGYGCFLAIDSNYSSYHQQFRAVSGVTEVLMFEDSAYGVFCGQVKDSTGRIYQITNGRFYYD